MASPLPFSLIAASVQDDREEIMDTSEEIFSSLPFQWVKAYNITRDKEMDIPLDWFFMINEFNGSSAGNCFEEAVCQGACEIVERHVSAIICREKKTVPYIDPQSVTNPSTQDLITKFTSAGIKLYINDFTLNTGIPTVGVLAYDPATFPETSEIVWTAGTAASPDKALSRALTEVAQLAGDFNTPPIMWPAACPNSQAWIRQIILSIPWIITPERWWISQTFQIYPAPISEMK